MEEAEYRKLAVVEDSMWYFGALHALIERELEVALGKGQVGILDAGCGTGGLIRRLSARHPRWRWTGIDVSPLACAIARGRVPCRIVEGSVTELPFGDRSFEAVVLSDVLYHVADHTTALKEAGRVLKPGGLVVLNVPAYAWLWSYHDVAVHGLRRYGRGQVQQMLKDAGFEGVRTTHWNAIPFPAIVVRRKLLPPPADGSDVRLGSAPVETLLRGAMALERLWLRAAPIPFGTSIFAVGRKRPPD